MSRKQREERVLAKAEKKAHIAKKARVAKVSETKSISDAMHKVGKAAQKESLSPAEERRVTSAIELSDETKELNGLKDQIEQLRVQLAGCGVAALGGTKDPAREGDYGWSPSYQDCLELRLKFDESMEDQPDVEETHDAKLVSFMAIRVTESLSQMFSFPVIPACSAAGPEQDLKNTLARSDDWRGFCVLSAGDRIVFEPYTP